MSARRRLCPLIAGLIGATMLGGCLPSAGPNGLEPGTAPPAVETDDSGLCWGQATRPAVYEEVMGEVKVVPAQYNAAGQMIRPAIYRRSSVPRLVQGRTTVRFEAVCPDRFTPQFIASVQRALKARGFYGGADSGVLDRTTTHAIRAFQARRGLDSRQLAIDSAREMGLVAVDLGLTPGG